MDKREMIERALLPLYGKAVIKPKLDEVSTRLAFAAFFTLLELQAIVIECEVEHQRLEHQYKPVYDKDVTYIRGGENNLWHWIYDGTQGTPGKAIAIIVPLEEENESTRD